jgi:hypothetical protein
MQNHLYLIAISVLFRGPYAESLMFCRHFVNETAIVRSVKLVAESLAVRLYIVIYTFLMFPLNQNKICVLTISLYHVVECSL